MSLPLYPKFKPLGLEDREVVQGFFDRHPVEASEFSFGNNFIWRHYDRPKWTVIDGALCLLFEPEAEAPYFLPPVGGKDVPAVIAACLKHAPRLSRVPAAFAERYCRGFECAPDRNDFDYVYAASDLAELQGKKFDGKRNRIRKLEREHAWSYRALAPNCLDDCRYLFEEWLAGRGEEEAPAVVIAQKEAIREALTHFEALGLAGGAVDIDGRLAAFSIGEPLTPEMAVIHIEIVSPCCEGLAQLMNREFVRNALSKFAFVNREQDLGVAGLRRAKLSYHPHHLVEKFHIWTD